VHLAALVVAGLLISPAVQVRSEQTLPVTFNQGIARVSDGWILSGTMSPVPLTDVLVRTNDDLVPQTQNPAAIPPDWRAKGYNHIGDIDVVGDVIYAPFEQSDYSLAHQATARYNASTLAFMDAVELPQHENSFVAIDQKTMTAYSMDHFDGDSLVRYRLSDWKPLPPLKLSETLHKTQGAAVAGDAIWISTSDPNNDLYKVGLASGHVELAGTLGHKGGEGEGIDATALPSGALHGMVIDANLAPVWLVHMDVTNAPAVTPAAPAAPAAAGSSNKPSTVQGSQDDRGISATGAPSWLAPAGVAALLAGYAVRSRRRRRPT
jgi:hypothetical protein